MSWTTENIITIAGELSWGPSSSQEGQRKGPGKSPPGDRAVGIRLGQGFPSLKDHFERERKGLVL